jgi:hypothetical protein
MIQREKKVEMGAYNLTKVDSGLPPALRRELDRTTGLKVLLDL